MDEFAKQSANARAEVFNASAARRGIGRALIIEKDYWVCWVLLKLGSLFGQPATSPLPNAQSTGLLFKGGTALSKVFDVIQRFSEDIDLTIDKTALGTSLQIPGPTDSITQRRVAKVDAAAAAWISHTVVPLLQRALAEVTESQTNAGRVYVNPDENRTVHVEYPRSLDTASYGATAYVRPAVRLELGARGDVWPSERRTIRAYAAEDFPELFAHSEVPVNALALNRTLWEKAMILHGIAHTSLAPARMSRHYYDLDRILHTAEGDAAVNDPALLVNVAEHSRIWFRRRGVPYDLAQKGTLRLVPDDKTIDALRSDYASMREMFFSEPPTFDSILDNLRRAEQAINGN